MQNRSLLLLQPRQLEWVVEDLPELQPHEVLVQTSAGAISIGSELPKFLGTARSVHAIHYPHMTGYESVGSVIGRGSAVTRIAIGDRVVAFYGHRTHGIAPAHKVIPVPDGIADEVALLAILTCDVTKGIRKLAPQPGEQALVTGAGAIGLLTIVMLKAYGVENIDVIEPLATRRAFALQFGARQALSPEAALSEEEHYDFGLECSSRNAAFARLQFCMKREGRLCILSDGTIEPLVLTPAFHEKELVIMGSSDGWDYHEHAQWYFDYVRQKTHTLALIFDHSTTAENLAATFEKLGDGHVSSIKTLVRYHSSFS